MMAQQSYTVRIDAPSPLVGEGYAAGRHKLTWVRGLSQHLRMRREPLTRLRFAKPPSPTRGEGKNHQASRLKSSSVTSSENRFRAPAISTRSGSSGIAVAPGMP
jgi:hypothetical protein